MGDPVILAVILVSAAVTVLAVLGWLWQRRREAAAAAVRRAEVAKERGFLQRKQQEIERLASQIIATSSTGTIAGFTVVRQIEAVFTDGHPTPSQAVEALKATAAEKGANALVNLESARPSSGKCLAHGDAVIVKPMGDESVSRGPTPPIPPRANSDVAGESG